MSDPSGQGLDCCGVFERNHTPEPSDHEQMPIMDNSSHHPSEEGDVVPDMLPNNSTDQTLGSPIKSNRHFKDSWVGQSTYTLNTSGSHDGIMTVESSKVADDLADFAEHDDNSNKTWSRLFVEKVLMKSSWYYPNKNSEVNGAPKLKQGWAYYERVTLARHFSRNNNSEPIERAEPGERRRNTQLYGFFSTKADTLDDWGVGVALYFNTMKFMAIALLVAGFVSVPNFLFYLNEYEGERNIDISSAGKSKIFTLPVSAVCDEFTWAKCESDEFCNIDTMKTKGIEFITDGTDTYVKQTGCEKPGIQQGIVNLVALSCVLLITLVLNLYQSKKQILFDEQRLTASDYSIIVANPPKDAYDPDEWEAFFSKYDEKGIALVTVLLDNQELLKKLVYRRTLLKDLQNWFPDIDITNESELNKAIFNQQYTLYCLQSILYKVVRPVVKPFSMLLYPSEIKAKLLEVNEDIKILTEKEYSVTDVIVTFETEAGQRLALDSLKAGRLEIRKGKSTSRNENELFRGEFVLDCSEPAEPSSINYLGIDTDPVKCFIQQTITFIIVIGLVTGLGFLVVEVRRSSGPIFAGFLVTMGNVLIPNIAKILMFIEQHGNEDDKQRSLYLKIAVFRWINTALVAKISASFTQNLGSQNTDLIPAMNGIMFSEIYLPPLLNFLDIMGNLSKHYFAPRARTLQQMLLCFKGTPYHLAEKYTDVSKIVFVAYFYSATNPALLFMSAIALIIRYYSDKYCLLRIWSKAPYIGPKLSAYSRRYFFTFAIIIGFLSCAYDWGQFSFDRVCITDTLALEDQFNATVSGFQYFIGDEDVTDEELTFTKIPISSVDARVCNDKECCQEIGISFPPVPTRFESETFKYMDEDQRLNSQIFGWTSTALIGIFLVFAFGGNLLKYIYSLFRGSYKPEGDDQQVDYSSVPNINGYIPQLRVGSYAYPLLVCDIDDVNQNLIGWNDPGVSYDTYNMIFDVSHDSLKRSTKLVGSTRKWGKLKDHDEYKEKSDRDELKLSLKKVTPIFSIVKHWSLVDRKERG